MYPNTVAWVVAGRRSEFESTRREREQLHAFREGQRAERVSLIDRLRGISRPGPVEPDLVCCIA